MPAARLYKRKNERRGVMKRRISMVLAVMCLLLNLSTVSFAAEVAGAQPTAIGGGTAEPYYVNTASMTAGLKIDGNTAYAYSEVFAKKVCFINVVMRLQRKEGTSWHTVSSWVESSTSGSKVMGKYFTLSTRGTYRVYAIFNVGGEELTCASASKTY